MFDNRKTKIIIAIVAIVLIILLVFLVVSCRSSGKNEDNKVNVVDNNNDELILDIGSGNIYTITDAKIIDTLNSIKDIKDSIQLSSKESKVLEDIGQDYDMLQQYIVSGVSNGKNNIVGDDFILDVYMEYKGENKYPSSFNFGYTYGNDKDHQKAQKWASKVVESIISQEVAMKMSEMSFGIGEKKVYTAGDIGVYVEKNIDVVDEGSNKKHAYYTVRLSKDSIKEYSVGIDAFDNELGNNNILYKTGIIESNTPVKNMEAKISSYCNFSNSFARTKSISTYRQVEPIRTTNEAYGNWEFSLSGSSKNGSLSVNATEVIDSTTSKSLEQTIKIRYTSISRAEKSDLLDDAEYFINSVVKSKDEIKLDEYKDKSKFNFTIEESGLNDNFGYPVNVKCEMSKSGGKNSREYVITVDIRSDN